MEQSEIQAQEVRFLEGISPGASAEGAGQPEAARHMSPGGQGGLWVLHVGDKMGSPALHPSRALGGKCRQPPLLWALRKVVPLGLAWSSQGPGQLAREVHTGLSLSG